MSTSFSTITPMNPATISKKPAYAVNTPQAQPAASTPMEAPYDQPAKKKSHWFAKTVGAVVVLAAAAGLARKYLPNIFDSAATVAKDANIFQKGYEYTKLGIAKAGDFINKYAELAFNWIKDIPNKIKGSGTNPTP